MYFYLRTLFLSTFEIEIMLNIICVNKDNDFVQLKVETGYHSLVEYVLGISFY